jgi:hypothetical protein
MSPFKFRGGLIMAVLSVPITLDKQRNLKFGFRAMIALEDLTGKTFFEIIQDLQDLENVKISKIRDIIWAALIHEDKELTLEQTTDILDQGNCMDLVGKLMEAVSLALGETEGNAQAGAVKKDQKANATHA